MRERSKMRKTAPKLVCAIMGIQQKELKLRWNLDNIDRRSARIWDRLKQKKKTISNFLRVLRATSVFGLDGIKNRYSLLLQISTIG